MDHQRKARVAALSQSHMLVRGGAGVAVPERTLVANNLNDQPQDMEMEDSAQAQLGHFKDPRFPHVSGVGDDVMDDGGGYEIEDDASFVSETQDE